MQSNGWRYNSDLTIFFTLSIVLLFVTVGSAVTTEAGIHGLVPSTSKEIMTTEDPVPTLEEFFDMEYNREMGSRCYSRLREDGYYYRLPILEKVCLCTLNCFHLWTLTEKQITQKAEYAEYVRKVIEERRLKQRYEKALPRTIALSTVLLAILVVGVIGKIAVSASIIRTQLLTPCFLLCDADCNIMTIYKYCSSYNYYKLT